MKLRMKILILMGSLAVLASLLLTIAVARPAEADAQIVANFSMVENPNVLSPADFIGASGRAHFKLNIAEKKFHLSETAKGLLPNEEYTIRLSITIGSGGGSSPVAFVEAGTATTDANGKLKFATKDVGLDLADLVPEGTTQGWRVDFEIGGTDATVPCKAGSNNCALACRPTVRITPADLGL